MKLNLPENKKDFIHKLAIVQEECNESIYWLELLKMSDYLIPQEFENINTDVIELIKLLTTIIKSSKNNL